MATFKAEPGAQVRGVGTDGEEIVLDFDDDGLCVVKDDFQEALVILSNALGVKRTKDK